MYICIHAYSCKHTHVYSNHVYNVKRYIHVCMYAHHVCMYAHKHTPTLHTHTHTHTHTHARAHTHTHIYMHTHTHTLLHMHTHTHTHTHTSAAAIPLWQTSGHTKTVLMTLRRTSCAAKMEPAALSCLLSTERTTLMTSLWSKCMYMYVCVYNIYVCVCVYGEDYFDDKPLE
jgi:hypothetical protein